MMTAVINTPTAGSRKLSATGAPKMIKNFVKYGDKALSSFLNRKLSIKNVKARGIVTKRPAMKIFRSRLFSFVNTLTRRKEI